MQRTTEVLVLGFRDQVCRHAKFVGTSSGFQVVRLTTPICDHPAGILDSLLLINVSEFQVVSKVQSHEQVEHVRRRIL